MDTLTLLAIGNTVQLYVWIGVLAVLVLFGTIGLMRLRKKLSDPAGPENKESASPFSLDELRRMHRDGRLTDEEFDKARRQMLGKAGHQPACPTSPPSSPENTTENPPGQRPSP